MKIIKMDAAQEKQLSQSLSDALDRNNLRQHLKRVWVFDKQILVVDFAYRNVHFGFDMTPLSDKKVSIDLIKRDRSQTSFIITSAAQGKDRLTSSSVPDEAVALVVDKAIDLINRIDHHYKAIEDGFALPVSGDMHIHGAKNKAPRADTKPHKVGIFTLPLGRNYGGILQAYALMKTVRDLGCDPILINRRFADKEVLLTPERDENDIIPAITNKIDMEVDLETRSFIENNILPISRPFRTSAELKKNIADYDLHAVISGSDQVWRAKYARGLLKDFFHGYLDPKDRRIKRISYAASFGADQWEFTEEQTKMAARYAKLFDAISVREKSATELCREHLGADARHVLDPTLLQTPECYRLLFADRVKVAPGRRITSYILDANPEKAQFMNKISDQLGMKIVAANRRFDSAGTLTPDRTVEGWLVDFYQADFVLTDSFHGVAFSILFNKPFIVFSNPIRGLARFSSILGLFELEARMVKDVGSADLEALLTPIDWIKVNMRLDELRHQSIEFLRNALEIPPKT
ncbi:polysaccharide pyruvyl transferase family protein [Paracoccus liaowanqingii]|uniref:Polysaccharide pyruvyl transferase family protein n=1 Tax=Paracoccus liaowanqingii TaxID=2560053 RepID=A0A4Z1CLJ0_9RHOB|nr:polysaccharide pyruvyl transferase family protein [Paracoccus liaowanqingii]TGN60126.1 polysaccharide pyruvyl transferase family protein [Paracoccus liaowanqingii]